MKFHEIGISLTFHTICALAAAREVAGPFHEIFEMREIFAPAARQRRAGARHSATSHIARTCRRVEGHDLVLRNRVAWRPGEVIRPDALRLGLRRQVVLASLVGVGASLLISVKFHEKSSSEWSASRGAGAPRGMYQNNLFHEMLRAPLKFHEIS